jgi:DNA-directed RNA polymerase subunit L
MASDQSENQLVAAGGGSIEPKDLRYAFGDFSFINIIKEKDDIPHFKEWIYVILKEVFQAINNNNAFIQTNNNQISVTSKGADDTIITSVLDTINNIEDVTNSGYTKNNSVISNINQQLNYDKKNSANKFSRQISL